MELRMAAAPHPANSRNAYDRLLSIHHMNTARVLVVGALASIEHVCERRSEIAVEQQTPWIIGELEHAVGELRTALSKADGEARIAPAAAGRAAA
jgi:hypothetical protein